MGRFIIILLFIVSGYANNIINVSYFPNNSKIDILFSLDTPFKGKVEKISNNDYKIDNIFINRIEQKKFKNGLNLVISPLDKNSVEFKINYKSSLKIKASLTAKGYGLRIRIYGFTEQIKTPDLSTQPVQTGADFNYINYLILIFILIILIIILFIVKKKMQQKLPTKLQNDGYKILYQKMIDPKNRILMIELFNKRYLLLLGDKNNILLDKMFDEDKLEEVSSQDGFNGLLENEMIKDIEDTYVSNASKIRE